MLVVRHDFMNNGRSPNSIRNAVGVDVVHPCSRRASLFTRCRPRSAERGSCSAQSRLVVGQQGGSGRGIPEQGEVHLRAVGGVLLESDLSRLPTIRLYGNVSSLACARCYRRSRCDYPTKGLPATRSTD